jgi:hypothetical protein
MHKVNNHPLGENSHNLVTLRKISFFCFTFVTIFLFAFAKPQKKAFLKKMTQHFSTYTYVVPESKMSTSL